MLDLVVAIAVVAGAVGWLGWRYWRQMSGKAGGDCGCGCGGSCEQKSAKRDGCDCQGH